MKQLTVITLFVALFVLLTDPGTKANASIFNKTTVGGAYATFAGKFGGELNRHELESTTEIGIAGCAAGSIILKFTIIINKDDTNIEFDGTSNKLTPEMLKQIRDLKKGDTFVFKNMRAQLPTGGKVDVVGKRFTVV